MNQVLLVDDLPEALAMLEAAVQQAFPQAQCHRAASVREATQLIAQRPIDLALVDLGLGDGQGHEVIAHLAQAQPSCAVVVATIYGDDDNLFQALQAGAQGYLLKDQSTDWLARQLQAIPQGQLPLSPAVARRLLRHFRQAPPAAGEDLAQLSAREREVLGLLAQGVQIADIGVSLSISRHTVGDHVKSIYRKLKIGSRAEAALRARSLGLI
jgi:DNA-binding NarL/FixJ family response regulator